MVVGWTLGMAMRSGVDGYVEGPGGGEGCDAGEGDVDEGVVDDLDVADAGGGVHEGVEGADSDGVLPLPAVGVEVGLEGGDDGVVGVVMVAGLEAVDGGGDVDGGDGRVDNVDGEAGEGLGVEDGEELGLWRRR
jgi:hypothetical protein